MVHNFRYEDHPVAIKIFIPARTEDAPLEYEAKFLREIKLLSKIEHSNIIKLIAASAGLMIITELMEGGSLKKNLKNIYPMCLEQCLSYALDVSQAMEYLHANGIVHRDLKPGNLLLTKDRNHVKLAGFEVARDDICDEMTCEAGTYRYMAPAQMSKDPLPKGAKICYDHKADVYSFALVLWSLIKNQIPFKDRKELMAAYATKTNIRPCLDELPEDIVPLLQSCWVEDPKLRPEFKEITEILRKILLNIYTPKINSLAGGNAKAAKHDTEIIEPNDGKDITQYPTMDEIWFKNVVRSGVQYRSPFQFQSELQSGAQMPIDNLAEKKHKKKSMITRFFYYFRNSIMACLTSSVH
ncbi:Protein kinase superfamily protein [Trifolium repens]|nr:Protein kinase superfamily protein [Trifolium repens]